MVTCHRKTARPGRYARDELPGVLISGVTCLRELSKKPYPLSGGRLRWRGKGKETGLWDGHSQFRDGLQSVFQLKTVPFSNPQAQFAEQPLQLIGTKGGAARPRG